MKKGQTAIEYIIVITMVMIFISLLNFCIKKTLEQKVQMEKYDLTEPLSRGF